MAFSRSEYEGSPRPRLRGVTAALGSHFAPVPEATPPVGFGRAIKLHLRAKRGTTGTPRETRMHDPTDLLIRRQLLEFGCTGGLGLTLGGLWRARAASPMPAATRNPIRACILVFYYGGPSHLDTYDLKPNAPAEVRGEF